MLYYLIYFCLLHFVRSQQDILNSVLQESAILLIDEEIPIGPEIDNTQLGDPKICGYSSKSQAILNQNGRNVTSIRDWPWIAVLVSALNKSYHFCGGAVITRRHILTAAHCFNQRTKEEVLVRLGEYDFDRDTESLTMDYGIEELRSHEEYYKSTFLNDIAILKLDRIIEYSIYVQPICLPSPDDDYTDTAGVVAGWGYTQFETATFSEVLLEISLPIWEINKCKRRYAEPVFCTNICAGFVEGRKDSCVGDSGGPLMQPRQDGRWAIIGVVSWGLNCAKPDQPGVYTAVNKYLKWIALKIQDVKSSEGNTVSTMLQPPPVV